MEDEALPVITRYILPDGKEILSDESIPILEDIIATNQSRTCKVVTIPLKAA